MTCRALRLLRFKPDGYQRAEALKATELLRQQLHDKCAPLRGTEQGAGGHTTR